MEVSGVELATWLVFRAEQTSSPNMLESDLKTVKCFRQSAIIPILFSYIQASLKNKAKLLFLLDLEPKIAKILIHNSVYEFISCNFVRIRLATTYALMYWSTAIFEEAKEFQLKEICKSGASL